MAHWRSHCHSHWRSHRTYPTPEETPLPGDGGPFRARHFRSTTTSSASVSTSFVAWDGLDGVPAASLAALATLTANLTSLAALASLASLAALTALPVAAAVPAMSAVPPPLQQGQIAPAPTAQPAATPELPDVPEGMKRCHRCLECRPLERFTRDSFRKDGRRGICRDCDAAHRRERTLARGGTPKGMPKPCPIVPPGMKCCRKCANILPLDDFCQNLSRVDGKHTLCRACDRLKGQERRDRIRASHGAMPVSPSASTPPSLPTPPEGMKRCSGCKEALLLEAFGKASSRPDGKSRLCRACERARNRKQYADARARAQAAKKGNKESKGGKGGKARPSSVPDTAVPDSGHRLTASEKRYLQNLTPPPVPVGETKRCYACKRDLPWDSFTKDLHSRDGKKGICRSCNAEQCRTYHEKRKQKLGAAGLRPARLDQGWNDPDAYALGDRIAARADQSNPETIVVGSALGSWVGALPAQQRDLVESLAEASGDLSVAAREVGMDEDDAARLRERIRQTATATFGPEYQGHQGHQGHQEYAT